MFEAVIIEDEKPSARRLNRMLSHYDFSIKAMLHSVEDAIDWFKTNDQPELIFLDIQLSDGLSFEIFEAISITSAIIFTTAYDAYALKAFKLNSIDYLLKPIDKDELSFAVQKFKDNKSLQPKLNLEAITNLISKKDITYKERFTTKIGQHLKIINVENVDCFYSENKTTYAYTNDNRSYIIEQSLEQVESLVNPEMFFKVNRKFCININSISDIISYTNSRLKIQLKHYKLDEIIVARDKVKGFKNWLS